MSYVLLEDGTHLDGDGVGARGHVTGEVVFTTSMTGYQESVTDPSYAGQLIIFTYPHIGNYGVSDEAMESDRIHARAVDHAGARDHAERPRLRRRLARLASESRDPGDHRPRHPRAGPPHPRPRGDARRVFDDDSRPRRRSA